MDDVDRKSFETPDAITRTRIRTGDFLKFADVLDPDYDAKHREKLARVDFGTYWREVVSNPAGDARVTMWHRGIDGINYALREYIPASSLGNADDSESVIASSERNLVRYLCIAGLVRAGYSPESVGGSVSAEIPEAT